MRMKNVLVLSSIFSLFFLISFGDGIAGTLQDIKARGKLIGGVKTDFPPFGFVDEKGGNKGFDVDIAKALAKGALWEGRCSRVRGHHFRKPDRFSDHQ